MKNTALIFMGILLLPVALYGAGPATEGVPRDGQSVQARVEGLVAAGLTPDAAQRAVQAMVQANFDSQQMQAVRETIRSAHQQGLPTQALAAKLNEGLAKKATPAMTVRAVEHVAERYAFAYASARRLGLDDSRRTVLGDVMVAGLAAGLTRQDMATMLDGLAARARQMNMEQGTDLAQEALRTARDMARQGVAPDDVVGMINRAMALGISADAMRQARQTVTSRYAGQTSEALARGYAQALGQGENSGSGAGAHRGGQGAAGGQGTSAGNSDGPSGGDSGGGSGGSSGGSDGGSSGGSGGSGGGAGGGAGGGSDGGSDGGGGGGAGGGSGGGAGGDRKSDV